MDVQTVALHTQCLSYFTLSLSGILTEFILYVKIHLNKICILYDLCDRSIRIDQWIGSMIKQTSLAW